MIKKCIGCGCILQTENPAYEGYIKKEVLEKAEYCERCFKITHYGETSVIEKNIDIEKFINKLEKNTPVIYLLDLLCISKNTLEPLKKIKNKKYIILTKKDLLPKSVKDKKLINYIKDNYINDAEVFIVSSKKMWNIDFIYNKLIKDKVKVCYVLGTTCSGKSSLINSLLKSRGQNASITTSPLPNTTTQLINIKLDNKLELIDTPGFNNTLSISNFIDLDDYQNLLPKKEIKPKIYNLKPGFMIIIDNILRIENNSSSTSSLIFYLKNELNYRKMKISTSNDLKILEKKLINIGKDEDIVIEGLGFIKIPMKSSLTVYIISRSALTIRKKMI